MYLSIYHRHSPTYFVNSTVLSLYNTKIRIETIMLCPIYKIMFLFCGHPIVVSLPIRPFVWFLSSKAYSLSFWPSWDQSSIPVFVGRGLENNFRINGQDINKTSLWKQPRPKYVFSPFSPDQLDSTSPAEWALLIGSISGISNILHSNLVYANSHISFSRFCCKNWLFSL